MFVTVDAGNACWIDEREEGWPEGNSKYWSTELLVVRVLQLNRPFVSGVSAGDGGLAEQTCGLGRDFGKVNVDVAES